MGTWWQVLKETIKQISTEKNDELATIERDRWFNIIKILLHTQYNFVVLLDNSWALMVISWRILGKIDKLDYACRYKIILSISGFLINICYGKYSSVLFYTKIVNFY